MGGEFLMLLMLLVIYLLTHSVGLHHTILINAANTPLHKSAARAFPEQPPMLYEAQRRRSCRVTLSLALELPANRHEQKTPPKIAQYEGVVFCSLCYGVIFVLLRMNNGLFEGLLNLWLM